MVKTYQKAAALLLALALIFALPVPASAAETTEARVPVTLTVVNTVSPISCTVPACLPVSLVDGYVVCANNAAITNTGKTGAIRVTKVDVQALCRTLVRRRNGYSTTLRIFICLVTRDAEKVQTEKVKGKCFYRIKTFMKAKTFTNID